MESQITMENKGRYHDENEVEDSMTEQSILKDFESHRINDLDIEQSMIVKNGTKSHRTDDLYSETETSMLMNGDSEKVFKPAPDVAPGGGLDDEEGVAGIIEETKEDEDINLAPDGGYGWFIVLGSVMVHLFIGGLERSSGILFIKLDEKFQQSAAATAWVLSLSSGFRLTLGPICSVLCNRYSHRSVVITGSLLVCISMVATAFAPNLTFTYFSYGVLGGFGRLLAYAPAVIIVGEYFNKKRGIAVGLSTSGVGFGSFLFPTMIEFFFTFYGFFGTFLILGAVMLHLAVSGCLFRPLWQHIQITAHTTRRKLSKDTELGTELMAMNQPEPSHKCDTEINNKQSSIQQPNNNETNLTKNKFSFSSRKSESKPKRQIMNFSLLKDIRFSCFCAAILLFTIAFQSAFVFIPPYAKSKGMSDLQSSYAIAIAGFFDGVGRILSGIVCDLKKVKKYRVYIYNVVMFFIGAVSFIVPYIDTFEELCVVCAFYGLTVGTYISQKSVVIVDILGVKNLVNSFGILIFFQGIGMFLGPPIAGIMKDINGHFNDGFYLGGACMIFGGLILTAGNAHHHLRQDKKEH
ncbi:Monocarboxylate transporter 14 [Mizuhopecten yessoensis]|uniref:Monocarboxylate transporter 14 n=1 Tax=Mizuhopecten yessoensis TaxID=6573 RepID=A0A210QV07_MIZYE|nr:Monocarboxylate transporter 14 [Mizuhopecten yessoensis]